ncbi:MAG: LPS-assembly protein LptD, partial [Bacteroidaceae bacterium]|nr:LPS-assembly protein LptD [Bacteroidaceae bacterium]
MRTKLFIFVLLFAVIFMMAESPISLSKKKKSIPKDSIVVVDSLHLDDIEANLDLKKVLLDTTKMDSLQLAIFHHNKSIDDSIAADSMNRKKKNGIDAPVTYTATDSLTYEGSTGIAHLYGNADVKYQNMEIVSDKIYMCLDSSLVHATGSADTLGVLKGKPVFTQGSDKYESDTMAFNFKTKKGLISQVYTAQQDGYLSSQLSKRSNDEIFLQHGRYTTCDLEHPDFYLALSRAKVRPGKDVVFGPAYLVVCDVPLPFAVPYGFFPFTKNYSSGFIMPTYGDETSRGFYLRDGGYYFAINDKMDLKLLGEIYTKGSWGISSASNYRTRYKYNGAFFFSYQCSVDGEKNMPDYTKTESFKLQWNHRQDTKASPFSSLSASVNFASTSYERNNLTSMYNPISYTQSTRTSSVSWGTTFSSLGLSLSSTMNLTQNMRDSSIAMTLPDLNISVSRFYPFKRRKMVGKERWYEKIALSYTGQISNSINTKEDKLMNSSLIKDWRNGMQHQIPLSASFSLFNYINITPSFNFTDRMYSNKIMRSWDTSGQKELADTIYGLNNVYNWNM